ncbi:hypothetical protein SAMN06295910_0214 [Allosphingosinicella indica]|uniref:Uncharacterized protein n=1 Tax=Allosphingosinicella indica TaxID=941907 RepID=A0A1X7FYS2_9SPHN|nr:hypothetical protein SAMN06295910_0214 [Allosphingosinicella indica]
MIADGRKSPEAQERGRKPWIEPNGEVHGSGSGAGGGNPGEDFDDDLGPINPAPDEAPDAR